MAYGQIDPARLDGDALTRWYLRSPTDIEDERQAEAAQRYADFFGAPDQRANETDGSSGDQLSPDPKGSLRGQDGLQHQAFLGGLNDGVYHPGQGEVQSTLAASSPWNCSTCHAPLPLPPLLPLPPQLQPLVPLLRSIPPPWGGPAPEPRRDKYPQCETQERQDRGICAQQPTEPAKAVCNASATDRRVWCDEHQGEIGFPDLTTAKRRDGRRWP